MKITRIVTALVAATMAIASLVSATPAHAQRREVVRDFFNSRVAAQRAAASHRRMGHPAHIMYNRARRQYVVEYSRGGRMMRGRFHY